MTDSTNPHSPTKSWLDGVATDQNGYDVDAEPGDSGSIVLERDGTTYSVSVQVPPEADDEPEIVDQCDDCGVDIELGEWHETTGYETRTGDTLDSVLVSVQIDGDLTDDPDQRFCKGCSDRDFDDHDDGVTIHE